MSVPNNNQIPNASTSGPTFGQVPASGQQASYQQNSVQGPSFGALPFMPGQQAYPQPSSQQTSAQGPSFGPVPVACQKGKSWVSAVLLSLFLGPFGGADFYLGYTKRGWGKLFLFGVQSLADLIGYGKQFVTQIAAGQPVDTTDPLPVTGPVTALSSISRLALAVWMVVTIALIVTRKGSYATDVNGVPLR